MSLQCHNLDSLFSMQIRILVERVWAGDKGRDRGISIGSGICILKGERHTNRHEHKHKSSGDRSDVSRVKKRETNLCYAILARNGCGIYAMV